MYSCSSSFLFIYASHTPTATNQTTCPNDQYTHHHDYCGMCHSLLLLQELRCFLCCTAAPRGPNLGWIFRCAVRMRWRSCRPPSCLSHRISAVKGGGSVPIPATSSNGSFFVMSLSGSDKEATNSSKEVKEEETAGHDDDGKIAKKKWLVGRNESLWDIC